MDQLRRSPTQDSAWTKVKHYGTSMAMGFGMGFFIGSSAVTLHCVVSRLPLRGMGKQISASGMMMGSIFALGSIVRT